MPDYDHQELRRLVERFSEMHDGELEAIAADANSLTDLARQALQGEISRRRLAFKLAPDATTKTESNASRIAEHPGITEVEYRELVTIRSFNDLAGASLAKGFLESAGIEAFVIGDYVAQQAGWFGAAAYGGIKLQVSIEDVEAAGRLLG
jgi:hypothetical protein